MLYIAWVDDLYVPFNPAIHAVFGEQYARVITRQRENEACTGEIQFPNPGVGLLSASRRRFVLISESETDDPLDAVLLGRFRILGMPTDFRADLITTQIIAAPDDLDEQLADAAEAYFALPYADPLFGDERRDPTAAIAARGCSWHIDPRTHAITITDVLGGGPLVDIGHDHAGDFSIRVTEPPLRKVKQRVIVEYEQSASGWIDIADKIGETHTMTTGSNRFDDIQFLPTDVQINTGAGWEIGQTAYRITDQDAVAIRLGNQQVRDFHQFTYSHSVYSHEISGGWKVWKHYYNNAGSVQELYDKLEETKVWSYDFEQFVVSYRYQQPRREGIELELNLAVQDVMGAVAEEDLGEMQIDDPTADIETPAWYPGRPGVPGEAVLFDGKRWTYTSAHSQTYLYFFSYVDGVFMGVSTPGFAPAPSIAPLPDRKSPNFVGTARGDLSVEHALLLMRSRLRYRLRCLEATVRPGNWAVMRDVSMAQSIRADHPRFGTVTGKVVSWAREWIGGDRPYRSGTITIGACLGTGAAGVGDIEDIDYAIDADPVVEPIDADSLGNPNYAVLDVNVTNDLAQQTAVIESELAAGRDPSTAINQAQTEISVVMRPLATVSSIDRSIRVSATLLDSPMGYDAGAS